MVPRRAAQETRGGCRQNEKHRVLDLYLADEYDKDVYLVSDVDARIAKLEKALREITALDYANAATNGAAYDAVQIASRALMENC